jgi:hypothetical protein
MVQYLAANETGQTAGARFDPLLQLRASIPEISKCRQLIVVTSEAWNAVVEAIETAGAGQVGRLHKGALELSMTTAFIYLPLCRQCPQGQGSGKNAPTHV